MVLQGLSWSFVELACVSAEFSLAEARYISAFEKVLPEKAVGIFVTAPLPWSLRITEVDIYICGYGEVLMPRHFRPAIPRKGFVELFRELSCLFDQGCRNALGVLVRDFSQHDKTGMPLNQRGDVTVVRTRDQIALPMARNGTIIDLSRAFTNGDSILDCA